MNHEAQTILADLKAKREIRGPVLHAVDYWRTYALMALYGAILVVFALGYRTSLDGRMMGLFSYMYSVLIVGTAITDGQRAINRRFDRLVEQLEKKGML
jgi:hypothetical protein